MKVHKPNSSRNAKLSKIVGPKAGIYTGSDLTIKIAGVFEGDFKCQEILF